MAHAAIPGKATVTIGDVKVAVDVWGAVTAYKTEQKVKGRKLKMPEALTELAVKQLKTEGLL